MILSSDGVFHPRGSFMSKGIPLTSQTPVSNTPWTHSTVRLKGSPFDSALAFAPATNRLALDDVESRLFACHSLAATFLHSLQMLRRVPFQPVFAKSESGFSLPQFTHVCFSVSENELAGHLLSKDDGRPDGPDKFKPHRPEMSWVVFSRSIACRAERLARARSGPDRAAVRPTGTAQGKAPNADAGEEMTLGKPGKVAWHNILNAPFIHFAGRYVPGLDKLAQPCGGKGVNLVVVDDSFHIFSPPPPAHRASPYNIPLFHH
jgi:hypothetical protein